jgi:hypothetical protein
MRSEKPRTIGSFLPVASRPLRAVLSPGGAGVLLRHPVHCSNRVSSQFVPRPEGPVRELPVGTATGGRVGFLEYKHVDARSGGSPALHSIPQQHQLIVAGQSPPIAEQRDHGHHHGRNHACSGRKVGDQKR